MIPTGPYTIHSRSNADSEVGNHGTVRGYGRTLVTVTDSTGRFVAWYERDRNSGWVGADVSAWVIDPADGRRKGVNHRGEFRTIRAHWAAMVNELLGVEVR